MHVLIRKGKQDLVGRCCDGVQVGAFLRRPDIAVAELCMSEGRVMLVNADRMVSCHRWLSPRDVPAFTFTGVSEATFNVEADPAPPRLLGMPFAAEFDRSKCFCVLPGGQV